VGIRAAAAGHGHVALGNVVGKRHRPTSTTAWYAFGAAAMAGTIAMPIVVVGTDITALFIMTSLVAVLIRTSRAISNWKAPSRSRSRPLFITFTLATA
jgi:hypothetical protein